MKRFIINTLIILVCFLLQTTAFQRLALADAVPNLLLIVAASIGYLRGQREGILVGFFCGLLMDMYGGVMGIQALLYMFVGYFMGTCNMIYYIDNMIVPVLFVGLCDFLYNFFYYIVSFLLRGRLNFIFYLGRIILPELVYTVLLSVVLYKLLHIFNEKIEETEGKEA